MKKRAQELVEAAKQQPLATIFIVMLLTGGSGLSLGALTQQHVGPNDNNKRIEMLEHDQGKLQEQMDRMESKVDRVDTKIDKVLLRMR